MLRIFVISTILVVTKSKAADKEYNALQFGTTKHDYIRFSYNMTSLRNSLSLCTWIKRVSTDSAIPVVFDYFSWDDHEILIGSDGRYNRMVGDHFIDNSHRLFTTKVGQWFHYCLTWSSISRTIQLYLDGVLTRTSQTSSGRQLAISGIIRFNRLENTDSAAFIFGGQLFQFNIYSEVLDVVDIKRMAEGGLCFDLDGFPGTMVLGWEEIMTKSRAGSVTEVTGCDLNKDTTKSNRYSEDL